MKKETPVNKNNEYLEELVRAGLATLNKNKSFYCVLEHSCDIKPFVQTEFLLKADLKQEYLAYLIDSQSFDENKFVWCSSQGQIVAVNTQWKIHQTQSPSNIVSTAIHWKEDALLITSKTDACVIKGNSTTRLFDLVVHGKIHEQLSAHQILQTLKMQSFQSSVTGEKNYEHSHKKIFNQQQNP